jgi:hypothetical protein
MQWRCHEKRRKKSVRLSPSVEALECRKLLSGPEPAMPAVPDNGTATLPRPMMGTEVIKAHKVVAFHISFLVAVSLPPTGDIQQFSLETAGSKRHRNAQVLRGVPLASATYDQADRTLTLKPTAPAPVRMYRLMTQASLDGSDPPGGQVTWTTLVEPPDMTHRIHGSSDWYDALNPVTWVAKAAGFS